VKRNLDGIDRWAIYRALGYERQIESPDYGLKEYPVPEVRAFHNSKARVKISTAPARSSKSYSAAHDVLPDILYPLFSGEREQETKILICGPEYEHAAKEFNYIAEALVHKKDLLGIEGPTRYLFQAKLGRLELHWRDWNVYVIGKSAKQLQSLLGDQWDVVILSETAQMDRRTWYQGLSTRYGRAIWPTTPSVKGRWIKEFYEESLARSDAKCQHFRFPPWANPFYDKSRFDEELARRGPQDPYFREQFLGDWDVWYGGRVFPTFQPDPVEDVAPVMDERGIHGGDGCHCIDPVPIPSDWLRLGGIDFGWKAPTVFLFLAVAPTGEIIVYDEYHATQKSMGEHISLIEAQARANHTPWPIDVYREPKGQSRQISEDAAMDHNFCSIPVNADRIAGRLRVQEYLDKGDNGLPRLRIVKENCPELVKSLTELHYDDSGTPREGGLERWLGADDPVDALKYPLLSRPSPRLVQSRRVSTKPTLDQLKKRHKQGLRRRTWVGYDRDRQGRINV
jgi:hypothetical protein